jgi:hypothetical protein
MLSRRLRAAALDCKAGRGIGGLPVPMKKSTDSSMSSNGHGRPILTTISPAKRCAALPVMP